MSNRHSATGSRRNSSLHKTSVPPAAQVENISWNDTSKLSGANCSVRAVGEIFAFKTCQEMRLTRARWPMATPFGTPVEPEV